jgi:hypothetical protein
MEVVRMKKMISRKAISEMESVGTVARRSLPSLL